MKNHHTNFEIKIRTKHTIFFKKKKLKNKCHIWFSKSNSRKKKSNEFFKEKMEEEPKFGGRLGRQKG